MQADPFILQVPKQVGGLDVLVVDPNIPCDGQPTTIVDPWHRRPVQRSTAQHSLGFGAARGADRLTASSHSTPAHLDTERSGQHRIAMPRPRSRGEPRRPPTDNADNQPLAATSTTLARLALRRSWANVLDVLWYCYRSSRSTVPLSRPAPSAQRPAPCRRRPADRRARTIPGRSSAKQSRPLCLTQPPFSTSLVPAGPHAAHRPPPAVHGPTSSKP